MTKGPFPTGIPVEGAQLVGREKELKQLCRLLRDGQSVVLVSPRRYGKTSLILETLRRLKKQGWFTSDIDLFYVASKKELAEKIVESTLYNQKGVFKGFLAKMKEGLANSLKRLEAKSVIDRYEFVVSFADPKIDENSLLDEALDFPQVFAQKNKQGLIFSYDEFGDITKLNGEILIKKMRAKFQRHNQVTYLFAGSEETLMRKLFTDKKQAFYRFARVIDLAAIPLAPFHQYIKETFKKLKIDCPDENIIDILNFTAGHPYYTQLICQQIYYSVVETKAKINKDIVQQGILSAIYAEKSALDALFNELAKKKYDIRLLDWLAKQKGSPYEIKDLEKQNIYQALTSLQRQGTIKRTAKGVYLIRDPLFQEFLKIRDKVF